MGIYGLLMSALLRIGGFALLGNFIDSEAHGLFAFGSTRAVFMVTMAALMLTLARYAEARFYPQLKEQ